MIGRSVFILMGVAGGAFCSPYGTLLLARSKGFLNFSALAALNSLRRASHGRWNSSCSSLLL